MSVTLNMVGTTFTYLHSGNKGYSVHQKEAKNLHWTQDGSGVATVYMDQNVHEGHEFAPGTVNYAWLYESRAVWPDHTRLLLENPGWHLENWDLIFTHNKEIVDLHEKCLFVPANGLWVDDRRIHPKTKLLSMISSMKDWTDGHRIRMAWADRLEGHADIYGRGRAKELDRKEEGLCDYMFSVAMENDTYSSYFTEKILDCFATGTIPIYRGSPDIGDFFNIDGIIVMDDDFDVSMLSEDYYYDRMPAIEENFEIVVENFVIPEDYIYKHYRHLFPQR